MVLEERTVTFQQFMAASVFEGEPDQEALRKAYDAGYAEGQCDAMYDQPYDDDDNWYDDWDEDWDDDNYWTQEDE